MIITCNTSWNYIYYISNKIRSILVGEIEPVNYISQYDNTKHIFDYFFLVVYKTN